jgi:hypothetical protein
MVRVIPGVEINVVKEIIPPAAYPSGVVALIGTAEKGPVLSPVHLSSWRELVDTFGSNVEFTLPQDAKGCFQNGIFEVVATRIIGRGGACASATIRDAEKVDTVELEARGIGEAGNNIKFSVEKGTAENTIRLLVSDGEVFEVYDDVTLDPNNDRYIVRYVEENSALITAKDLKSKTPFPKNNPVPLRETNLKGGKNPGAPSTESYEEALELLEAEAEVDLVYACDVSDPQIHALIEAHCNNMSREAQGRIGIGTVGKAEEINDIIKRTEVLSSDRFIIVAPYGVAGAVAGLISQLNYYESPTFKSLSGIADLEQHYTPSKLRQLLNAGILPVRAQRGRGIHVVKGITTSKEQISVMRTTDHAVRVVKGIGDRFIGTLNDQLGRTALKAKITDVMARMEEEGAIVPSTDLTQPAFIVDVYSSQLDFAQGIVRVDLAIRPVRAIDYIYATINVQA